MRSIAPHLEPHGSRSSPRQPRCQCGGIARRCSALQGEWTRRGTDGPIVRGTRNTLCRKEPPEEVDERVAARLARQSLFSRDYPPRFTFYVHEFVLRTPVGGAAMMSDQLHHLLRMSVRSYLTLRVVPAALGAHAAMTGAFTLIEFAEFKPVTYLKSACSWSNRRRPLPISASWMR
ncbi:MAG: DUF5753 domain-containing protein [Pseudonocardiaceae bacterium]